MIINKDLNLDRLKVVDGGTEGCILKFRPGKVIKDFRDWWHWDEYSFKALNNKLIKLIILKEMNLKTHPKIYNFYYSEYFSNLVMYAYVMEYLRSNYIFSILDDCFDVRFNLVSLIINSILEDNQKGIYNFDISRRNLYISKKGQLKYFDIDNFQVLDYPTDIYTVSMEDFISKKDNQNLYLMQNFTFFLAIMNILFNYDFRDYNHVENIKRQLIKEKFDDKLLAKFLNIIEGKQEDIHEVLALIKENKIQK